MKTGAWTLTLKSWTDGLTGVLGVVATRSCGRTEDLTVYRFPAGWRLEQSESVPKSVTAAALRLAKETGL